jgi:hypothetical protein
VNEHWTPAYRARRKLYADVFSIVTRLAFTFGGLAAIVWAALLKNSQYEQPVWWWISAFAAIPLVRWAATTTWPGRTSWDGEWKKGNGDA